MYNFCALVYIILMVLSALVDNMALLTLSGFMFIGLHLEQIIEKLND